MAREDFGSIALALDCQAMEEPNDRPVCILSAQIVIKISKKKKKKIYGQYFDIVHVSNANVWTK